MSALKQSILSPFRALATLFRELRFELDDLIRFKSLSLMESERYWRVIFAQVILVAFLGGSLGAILPWIGFIDSNIVNGIVIIMAIIVLIGGFVLFALNVRITAKRLKTLHKELIEESAHSVDSNFSYFSSFFIRFITPKYFYISLVILVIIMACVRVMFENIEYEVKYEVKSVVIFLVVVGTFISLFYSIILVPNLTKILDIKQFGLDFKTMLLSIVLFCAGFLLVGFSSMVIGTLFYTYEDFVCFLYMFYGGMGLLLLGLWQYSGTYMKIWLVVAAYIVLTYLIIVLSVSPDRFYRLKNIEKEATLIPALFCFLPLLIWHIRQRAFAGVLGIIWICYLVSYLVNGHFAMYLDAATFYIFAMIGFYCVRFFDESESFFGKFIRLFSKLWICGSISGLIFLILFFNDITFALVKAVVASLLGFFLSLSLQRLKMEYFSLLLLVLFNIFMGIYPFLSYLHFWGESAYNANYTTLLSSYFVISFILLFLFALSKLTGADSKYQSLTHLRLCLVLCFSAMIVFCIKYLDITLNGYLHSIVYGIAIRDWEAMEIRVFFIILFSLMLLGLFWQYNVLFALSFVGLIADFIFFPRLSVFFILLFFGMLWEIAKILFLNRQRAESIS
ncbi:hypothetical protein C6B36_10020 [Helicobacter cinaedi]|uniref:hypothetical protein n=1 Tax=Helicobacter cinaedi TaxID=213 RepID=UPI000CF0CA86|nr:hypothetical protein [Helicobacter cinaedi]AWK62640.1 hypothetical protein C6B36_10020 [Helicobacter cinaedi]QOQ96723.1 hypothetical protein HW245_03460 [Helicobacter cinaedi]